MRAWVIGLAIVAILAGFFPTWIPIEGPGWWHWVALRVALQLGGCAVIGWASADPLFAPSEKMMRLRVKSAIVAVTLGLVVTWAPVLDLIEGPVELERATVARYVERWTMNHRPHKREEICFQDVDHRLVCIAPYAPKIWWVGEDASRCGEDETVDVAVLRHLELVAGIECRPATWAPEPDPYAGGPEEARAGYAWLEELQSLPPAVAARRAPMVSLTTASTVYTVVYGSEAEDRYAIPLLRELLARRDDLADDYMQQQLRETYGVTE